MRTEKNQLIRLTSQQQNPGAARPEDFTVTKSEDVRFTPGHGQCGDTRSEYDALLRECKATGRGAPRPTEPGDAEALHTPGINRGA